MFVYVIEHVIHDWYWNNDDGWVKQFGDATVFTYDEMESPYIRLPIDGVWVEYQNEGA